MGSSSALLCFLLLLAAQPSSLSQPSSCPSGFFCPLSPSGSFGEPVPCTCAAACSSVNTTSDPLQNLVWTASVLAGSGSAANTNGLGTAASFSNPNGLGFSAASGTLIVGDYALHFVRAVSPAGAVTTLAGSTAGFNDSSVPSQVRFNQPRGSVVSASGLIYLVDGLNNRVRAIQPSGATSTLLGNGSASSVDGVGRNATLSGPTGIAMDSAGSLFIAEYGGNFIRRVTFVGGGLAVVSRLCGNGSAAYAEGLGSAAAFNGPYGIAAARDGSVLFVTDRFNNRVALSLQQAL
jgi:hypothetical protein